jgi:ABC-type uncharacterized transport system ATPase subunit
MKIKITKDQKIELLKAIKSGEFDTEIFPELALIEPAKFLSPKEMQAFIQKIENDC